MRISVNAFLADGLTRSRCEFQNPDAQTGERVVGLSKARLRNFSKSLVEHMSKSALRTVAVLPLVVGWSLTVLSMRLITAIEQSAAKPKPLMILNYGVRTAIAATILVPAIGIWVAGSRIWESSG